jgi:hypothetical protein
MKHTLFVIALVMGGLSWEAAAQTAQQTVTVVVQEINALSVSNSAVSLTINAASTAGQEPDAVTNNATTYSLTTNGENKKITAELDSEFSTGITLEASLAAPSGSGTSAGLLPLSTSAQNLVTGLTRVKGTGLTITYSASATVAAAPNGSGEARTVVFTITSN